MFATGRGGREQDLDEVARTMVEAIIEYLGDYENVEGFTLKDIHLCAYSQLDVAIIKPVMDAVLAR